jgi:5-methylcytosine-specific restriction endonuclease McrA
VPRGPRGHRYRQECEQVLAGATHCTWCRRPISRYLPKGHPLKATCDHVVAVVDGGGDQGNLVPACFECNTRRGARSPNVVRPPDERRSREW